MDYEDNTRLNQESDQRSFSPEASIMLTITLTVSQSLL